LTFFSFRQISNQLKSFKEAKTADSDAKEVSTINFIQSFDIKLKFVITVRIGKVLFVNNTAQLVFKPLHC